MDEISKPRKAPRLLDRKTEVGTVTEDVQVRKLSFYVEKPSAYVDNMFHIINNKN